MSYILIPKDKSKLKKRNKKYIIVDIVINMLLIIVIITSMILVIRKGIIFPYIFSILLNNLKVVMNILEIDIKVVIVKKGDNDYE